MLIIANFSIIFRHGKSLIVSKIKIMAQGVGHRAQGKIVII